MVKYFKFLGNNQFSNDKISNQAKVYLGKNEKMKDEFINSLHKVGYLFSLSFPKKIKLGRKNK